MDYTAHLLKVIPKWLDGKVNYTEGKILANTTAATQYARVQPKSYLTQPQPALTAPKQTKPNPLVTVSSQQSTTLEIDSSKKPLIVVINQLKNQITTIQATANSQSGIIAQLIQDNKTSLTMASTLPSQLESVISRVDSSITTTSESYKAHMDDISIRMTTQLHNMHQAHLEQTKIANTEQNRKIDIMFSDVAEIGDCYNGECTSYGKCIHGVGNKLLLHQAKAARMNNQIKFIINHIATQSEFLEGNGLFEAFQENQA